VLPAGGPPGPPAPPPPRPKPPNPVLQLPETGDESEIELAVTAPVLPAVPTAVAHLPTARSEEDAEVRWVKVVDAVRVTTTLAAALVRGLVSETLTVEPETEVTEPEAMAKFPPNRLRKPLRPEPAPEPPPEGGAPEAAPPVPPAPPPLRPKPPNPAVQLPEVGCEMVTEVAVTGPPKAGVLVDEEVVGFPTAETHDPTATVEAVAGTVWSKVVVGV
jgi:hypothetical protein